MLITFDKVVNLCLQFGIKVNGVFHVGAHECEELQDYLNQGIEEKNIIWVEGNEEIYKKNILNGKNNVILALVDEDVKELIFNVTNNGQSSSILELGSHLQHHPDVHVVKTEKRRTTTIKNIQGEYNIDFSKLNMWNFDIQGAELRALKGAGDLLNFADVLYLEVNSEKVYKDCALIEEIDAHVSQYNFKRVATAMTPWGWGDAVYIKFN